MSENAPAVRLDGPVALPIPQPTPATASDPDAAMSYVQGVRMNLAQNLINAGAASGTNKESTRLLLDTLKDMGGQAVQQKRIQVENDSVSALGDLSALVNRVIDAVDGNTGRRDGPIIDVPVRTISDTGENFSAVPGETDTTPPQGSYQEFVGRMRGDPEAAPQPGKN